MFEVLEHAADVGFRAWGGNARELFASAAEALVSLAMEPEGIEARERYDLSAEGDSLESLLVNWLSEVLYYIDGRGLAMTRFEVVDMGAGCVIGIAWGERRDRERHPARLVVKGITYHQLKIEQANERWVCEVFVDV
jgi:SHS2 domain-containing protein